MIKDYLLEKDKLVLHTMQLGYGAMVTWANAKGEMHQELFMHIVNSRVITKLLNRP